MRPLLAVALLSALATAAPVPKAKKDDKSLLLGTWTVTSDNGKTGDERYIQSFEFKDGDLLHTNYRQSASVTWTIELDPTATPKTLRWQERGGKTTWDCVYELSGDTLKVGIITGKAEPPAEVAKGPNCYLVELTRDTAGK